MRDWFFVGAKLMGVYFLYTSLALIVSSTSLISTIVHSRESIMGTEGTADILLTTCFVFVASLGFAYILLFQTDWLADSCKLTDRPQAAPMYPASGMLQTGIMLIGIYVFCTHIGSLASVVLTNLIENNMYTAITATQPKGLTFSMSFIPPAVTLFFSLFLIFGSGKMAAFLEKRTMAETAQGS